MAEKPMDEIKYLGTEGVQQLIANTRNEIDNAEFITADDIDAIVGTGDIPTGDYDKYGLPVLALTGDVSAMTKENKVTLEYVYGNRSGTCTMKWQGATSLGYPKKNYTIKFDNAFEAKTGWGEQTKYCLKANYIDHSHARNIVSCKLWGQSVKSRTTVNEKLSALPNGGAIDGFPIIITLNGAFHGLYTFNIPKDGWMFGMGQKTISNVTETLSFDTYISSINLVKNEDHSATGVTFNSTTTVGAQFIRKQSTLTGGGRTYLTWDTTKLIKFAARAWLFNQSGELVKMFGESSNYPTYTLSPYANTGYKGDLDGDAWLEPSDMPVHAARLTEPLSLPVPEGYTVIWEFILPADIIEFPDGSLTKTWSSETEANNTWVYTWIKTGIQTSFTEFGIDENERAAIVCADAWVSATGLKAEATLNGDFELEYVTDEDDSDWVLTSLNTLINACINSDGTDLDTTIAQYLDWDSAIDYYIHTVLEAATDCTNKNYLLATYDGVKWFFSNYDRDSTYGLYWDGSTLLTSGTDITAFSIYASMNRVMELIYTYKKDALKARYKELRTNIMSEDNVSLVFENFCKDIPAPVYNKDIETWPKIPSNSVVNVRQILDWYRKRVRAVDIELDVGPNSYIPTESTVYSGCYYRYIDGATEWINPPMVENTEYRTTERWNGKVVYTKIVPCGALPSSATSATYVGIHNTQVLSIEAVAKSSTTTLKIPSASVSVWVNYEKYIIVSTINATLTDYNAFVTLKYVKD